MVRKTIKTLHIFALALLGQKSTKTRKLCNDGVNAPVKLALGTILCWYSRLGNI